MTNPCNSIQILNANPSNIANCKGYEQEAVFISYLQQRKSSSPRLRNVYICICDASRGSCNALPMCRDAVQGSYDVLFIDSRKRRCEAIELKLDVGSHRNIENILSRIEEKFRHNCCRDYCSTTSYVVVFAEQDILKRVEGIARKRGLRTNIKFMSLDRLKLSTLSNS